MHSRSLRHIEKTLRNNEENDKDVPENHHKKLDKTVIEKKKQKQTMKFACNPQNLQIHIHSLSRVKS